MNYYLAGAYDARVEIDRYARHLRLYGITVTSRWHDGHMELAPEEFYDSDAYQRMCACEDVYDIDKADVVLVFTEHNSTSGGYHTELGYALGRNKCVYIIGPVLNPFHRLATCIFQSFDIFCDKML